LNSAMESHKIIMETREPGSKPRELNTGTSRQKNIKIRVLENRDMWNHDNNSLKYYYYLKQPSSVEL